MEPVNILNARNHEELRVWLEVHHTTERECWCVVKRGCPADGTAFWYFDAVEEALCFGWIDSTTKRGGTAQKFAPRRKGNLWSELNKERCRRLEKL